MVHTNCLAWSYIFLLISDSHLKILNACWLWRLSLLIAAKVSILFSTFVHQAVFVCALQLISQVWITNIRSFGNILKKQTTFGIFLDLFARGMTKKGIFEAKNWHRVCGGIPQVLNKWQEGKTLLQDRFTPLLKDTNCCFLVDGDFGLLEVEEDSGFCFVCIKTSNKFYFVCNKNNKIFARKKFVVFAAPGE